MNGVTEEEGKREAWQEQLKCLKNQIKHSVQLAWVFASVSQLWHIHNTSYHAGICFGSHLHKPTSFVHSLYYFSPSPSSAFLSVANPSDLGQMQFFSFVQLTLCLAASDCLPGKGRLYVL